MGIEAQVTSTIKLKGAASVGQYVYANNPDVYYASDDFTERLRFGVEGRWAKDSSTDVQVRREWNVNGYYRLGKEYSKANFHAHINAMHARYCEAVDVWMLSAGLSMRVE